ncbi:MAG: hypothetical protein KA479_08795 [Saprospiraceae bacterium]|nr:hypothetical protein [Saprospiraceae bacterium]
MKHPIFSFMMVILLGATLLSTGCKKKDSDKGCSGFPTVSGDVQVNGEDQILIAAQSIINAFGGQDNYLIQLTAIEDDCNTTHTISFNIDIPTGSTLNGVYPFKDFFDADSGEASGDYTVQVLEPLSQSAKSITSGSLSVENKGGGNYVFDMNANLAGGGNVKMKVSAKL